MNRSGDQEFIDELRAVLRAASAADILISQSSPQQVIDTIVRTAARAIPSPEGALLLIDRERQVLTFHAAVGQTAAATRDLTVPLGHGIAGLVAVSGQALAISNAQDDPRHARDIARQSGYLPTTILAVPVMGGDETPMGVLELLDRQHQPTYSLADMELLSLFAAQISPILAMGYNQDTLATRVDMLLARLRDASDDGGDARERSAESFRSILQHDDAMQRTRQLAELVASVAAKGAAESDLCIRLLTDLRDFLDAKPKLGPGMFP